MTLLRNPIPLLCLVMAAGVLSCVQSKTVDRNAETRAMLTREIPIGMQRERAVARLDSLKILFAAQDTAGILIRALVRNTSRSALGVGHLQMLLYFGSDGALTRREFKEVIVAP